MAIEMIVSVAIIVSAAAWYAGYCRGWARGCDLLQKRCRTLREQRDAANATIDQLKEMLANEGENNGC